MSRMKRYMGIYIVAGTIRRMTFEATDLEDARQQADKWGVGVEGEAVDVEPVHPTEPTAFNLEDAKRLLGGIGRSTIYQMLYDGRLERVPGVRRVLITRRSIERAAAGS